MADLQAMADWLNSPRTAHKDHDAVPVEVHLGEHRYEGIRFLRDEYAPRYDQHTTATVYYLCGQFPVEHMESTELRTGTTYRFEDDEGDWYLGAHCPEADPENREPHCSPGGQYQHVDPFGPTFMLMRWPHEMFEYRIDQYGRRNGAQSVPSRAVRL